MKHIVQLLLLAWLSTILTASDIAPTTQEIRAFVLPKNSISIRASYSSTNGSLDFFNLNAKRNNADIYSAIGNSSGLNFAIAYGAHQHISLYYNLEALNIDYAGEKLKNRKNELFARVNFYDNPHNMFDDFSMDIGYIRNSSKELNPQITDLSDNSYYLRFLLGSKMNSSLLNLYTGFKYTSINTTLFNKESDRNEKALSVGMSNTMEFTNYILDTNYEYIRLFDRDSQLGENKSNHIFTIHLSRVLSDNLLIFIGTKIMLNQFNGIIPYLYNRHTQSAFDKKYNYLKLGFVYNFNYSLPTSITKH